MKLHVFVHDKPVATLESVDGFRHVLTYHPDVAQEEFISLLMPVRTESYIYPDLHPVFRMNLPEGFLLSTLQEQLGPEVGASPLNLLSVVGRNSIGRIKVAVPGADPTQPPMPFELLAVLTGDNSEAAFIELVRRYAASGVSGVLPKFLAPSSFADHGKGTLATDRYIIKGTSAKLPGVALNEHLCMQVVKRAGIPAAHTEVSEDGQALVVHRFDYESDSITRKGMEDLCSLLALKPEEKYQSTWEKVVNRIKDVVSVPQQQNAALAQLADLLLLTYALRNADCHTKNIALLYSSREAVTLSPVYDMLTITAYADFANNSPGLSVGGRRSWKTGKTLENFLQIRCNVMPSEAKLRIERICEAMVDVSPQVLQTADRYPAFREVGKRMIHAWNDGMNGLRLHKTWSLPSLDTFIERSHFSDLKPVQTTRREQAGRSQLLGNR